MDPERRPGLDRLWAGWRTSYIEAATGGRAPGAPGALGPPGAPEPTVGCVFCAILASDLADDETHVVWRHPGGGAVGLLNAYPYGSGHLMVLPTRHTAGLHNLGDEEAAEVWDGVRQAVAAVHGAYRPGGINMGANIGEASGAGIPGHLHIHVLPRWSGDTNFMTTVAETRVLPEPLSVTAAKLRAAWPPGM